MTCNTNEPRLERTQEYHDLWITVILLSKWRLSHSSYHNASMFITEVEDSISLSNTHKSIKEQGNNFGRSRIASPKSKEDQSIDGDSESCTSSIQSYYSSSQNILAYISNEKAKYLEEEESFKTKPSQYPDMPPTCNWFQSEIMPVYNLNKKQDSGEIRKSQPLDLTKQTSYGSSVINPSKKPNLYPEEKFKTFIAGILSFFGFMATVTSLVLTHERLPDRNQYGPLPDVVLDNLLPFDWALDFSEYIIVFSMNAVVLLLLFHRHRFIVFRRFFLIMAILYLYRAVTMYVTVLPIASSTYPCDPKMGHVTVTNIVHRIIKVTSGFGLSINGKHVYCGDFIYSGHTVTLVISYLSIAEYTPGKYWLLHWVFWFLAALGIILLQFAHGHYTIDIVVAYYVTTRVFWTYHTLANNVELKEKSPRNFHSREWWFRIFQYFEKNVGGPVPNEYDWPFWWPKKWYEEDG